LKPDAVEDILYNLLGQVRIFENAGGIGTQMGIEGPEDLFKSLFVTLTDPFTQLSCRFVQCLGLMVKGMKPRAKMAKVSILVRSYRGMAINIEEYRETFHILQKIEQPYALIMCLT
jgi:hypothetical protein